MAVNKVIILGNVGKEPVIEILTGGKKVAKFSVATTEKAYALPNGTQAPEKTEWHHIVAWGKLAEVVEQYIGQGTKVYIEGKNRTRSYEKNGVTHWITEIHVDNVQAVAGYKNGQVEVNNSHVSTDIPYNVEPNDLPF